MTLCLFSALQQEFLLAPVRREERAAERLSQLLHPHTDQPCLLSHPFHTSRKEIKAAAI
jgi:hypothetical protein